MGDGDNKLVDPDANISVDNYTHYSDGDWWGGGVTEGYGKDRDRYEKFWADGDKDGNKDKITGTGWAHGLPPADDAFALLSGGREAAHELWNFVQTGDLSDVSGVLDTLAATVGLAGDAIGIADDPLATLASWAVSWVLEHVTILRFALDGLAGNPDVINAYANTWSHIADRLAKVGQDFDSSALSGPGEWTGGAHDSYQTMASDVSTALYSAAKLAEILNVLLVGIAQLVNGVRDLVKELIAQLVGLFIDGGEALVGGEPEAAGGLARAAAKTGSKVLKLLADLAKVLEDVGPIITGAKAILSSIDSAWRQYQKNQKKN